MRVRRVLLVTALAWPGLAATCIPDGPENRVQSIVTDCTTFTPAELRARRGDVVTFVNRNEAAQTLREKTGRWQVDVAGSSRAVFVLTDAGTFEYSCVSQSGSTGKIIVEPSSMQ